MIKEGSKSHFRANAFSEFYGLIHTEYSPVNFQDIPIIQELFLDNFFIQTDTQQSGLVVEDLKKVKLPVPGK